MKPEKRTALAPLADDPLWYKDAIIYELHVKAFYDSNGDGIGDFAGLTGKLDYLQDLGVNTLWLLPFYPSPMKDDGYDISDYRNVYEQFGTRKDFKVFTREAHRRGLRVITELVINHTSDQHPWFQAARRAPPGSPKREYYVWSDTDDRFPETRIIFSDTEKSNWAWDDVAKAYYWHRFFAHQPDLNHNNPQVVRAMTRVMRFWLDQGVDGLRLDAIPYLCVREGTLNENLPETHAVIREMREVIDAHYKNRMFLAEANQWPEDVRDYFANGDECHMAFHFPLMPRMYMAIAQEDRHPIVEIMAQTPEIPENCQWAIFLRNHDELTLEMVTSRERDYMYQMYATDPRARLNLGIRRRLAPLLDNDPERIKLMNSLLLSMPGSPIIYYGDEIGMGDNIYLGDRNGVRTPMQWSPDRNAGFSRADPQRLYLPPIMDPVYGYEAVNVEAQAREPSSLLNWMRRMLAVRKGVKAFGRGTLAFLHPGNRKILAYLREYGDETILCVANLSRTAQPVELDLARFKGFIPVEVLGRVTFPPVGELPYLLTLHGHAFFWFKLMKEASAPEWHEERLAPEVPLMVLFDGWHSLFRDRVVPWRIAMAEKVRKQFESEVLPHFMAAQRWFAGKGQPVEQALLADYAEWKSDQDTWLVAIIDVRGENIPHNLYLLPLALVWEEAGDERMRALAPASIARVRQQSRIGTLGDAFADEAFCRSIVEAMGEKRETACIQGVLRSSASDAFAAYGIDMEHLALGSPGVQASNTTVRLGDRLFLKAYRRLRPGINPEVEIGRFLTDVAHYPHAAPLLGTLEYRNAAGETTTLALLQGYLDNQGDAWNFTLSYLERFLESRRMSAEPAGPPAGVHAAYLALMGTLGRRTAELHLALATRSGDPAFDPEPIAASDVATRRERVHSDLETTLALLSARVSRLPETERADVAALLARRSELAKRIAAVEAPRGPALKIRHHGDFHLGQVLLVRNDFAIIDFEGEPDRPFAERRAKGSPLRDVAGMLRSFSYAARSALAHVNSGQGNNAAADLVSLAEVWQAETEKAFVAGYREAVSGGELFSAWEDNSGLLELFLIEKALYELRYELATRLDWAVIPLRDLLAYAGSAGSR